MQSSGSTATFTSLSIKSSGTFIITASSSDMLDGSYSSLTITAAGIGSLSLSVNDSNPSAFFTFRLKIEIFSDAGNIWTSSSSVDISPTSKLGGDLSVSTSNGTCYAYIYALISGPLDITAKVGTVSKVISITVSKDVLLISLDSDAVRFM